MKRGHFAQKTMDDLERILELSPAQKKQFFDELGFYTYALCEIDDDNKRIPFYIGKGKNTRCLSHLSEKRIMKRPRE